MLKFRIENPFLRGLVEWIVVIGLAILLALVTRNFIFRVTRVTGYSMNPTLNHGDVLILNRFSYLFTSPRVGDIVAFPYPSDPSEFFIKRVIAAPGDEIDWQDNQFTINGIPLEDSFSDVGLRSGGNVSFPMVIDEGYFFVLGDNRNASRDSRYMSVGNISGGDMLGRSFVRIWPMRNFGRVD